MSLSAALRHFGDFGSQSSFVLKDFTKHLRIEMLQSNLYHEENRSNLLDPSFNSVSNSVLYVLTSESGSMRGKSSSSSLTSHNKRVGPLSHILVYISFAERDLVASSAGLSFEGT